MPPPERDIPVAWLTSGMRALPKMIFNAKHRGGFRDVIRKIMGDWFLDVLDLPLRGMKEGC